MPKFENFLLDSNTIIGYLEGRMPPHPLSEIDKIVNQRARIFVITQMEILGWFGATPVQLKLPNEFVSDAIMLDLTTGIIKQTIMLRQNYKIKLPDAIIATTALFYDLILLSRNNVDFKKIDGLKIESPWEL